MERLQPELKKCSLSEKGLICSLFIIFVVEYQSMQEVKIFTDHGFATDVNAVVTKLRSVDNATWVEWLAMYDSGQFQVLAQQIGGAGMKDHRRLAVLRAAVERVRKNPPQRGLSFPYTRKPNPDDI